MEVYDPAKEDFYYYSNLTGAVQWDKPRQYVMAADDAVMSACIKLQTRYRARQVRKRMREGKKRRRRERRAAAGGAATSS